MTGRRPGHTRIYSNDRSFRDFGVDKSGLRGANWTTLPGHFKDNGYLTLGGGKTFHPGKCFLKAFECDDGEVISTAHVSRSRATQENTDGVCYLLPVKVGAKADIDVLEHIPVKECTCWRYRRVRRVRRVRLRDSQVMHASFNYDSY